MNPTLLYTACVIGAAGLFLLVRPGARSLRIAGALVALAVFAWLVVRIPASMGLVGFSSLPPVMFWVFALIAVASAGRMITHPRPVYCALYFIMVVLSTAALLLLLGAEFMAFALIIVYAGAILVTYLFVIMLAQQADNPDNPNEGAEYDRIPREPLAAVVAGMLMMAALTQVLSQHADNWPNTGPTTHMRADAWWDLELMPEVLKEYISEHEDEPFTLGSSEGPRIINVSPDGFDAELRYTTASGREQKLLLPHSMLPDNIHRVGLSLVARFPASLELAGVILLMAMLGAVVLARRQVELGEDELRRSVGMRPLPVDRGDDADSTTSRQGRGGASS